MTPKDKVNSAAMLVALVGGIVCFVMGHPEAGAARLAFAGGHALPSPVQAASDARDAADEP